MKRPLPKESWHALRIWQSRQQSDGYLVAMLVLVSLFPLVNFLLSPSTGSAFVTVLFLAALAIACVRLMISAARVVRIHQTIYRTEALVDLTARPRPRPVPVTQLLTGPEVLN